MCQRFQKSSMLREKNGCLKLGDSRMPNSRLTPRAIDVYPAKSLYSQNPYISKAIHRSDNANSSGRVNTPSGSNVKSAPAITSLRKSPVRISQPASARVSFRTIRSACI